MKDAFADGNDALGRGKEVNDKGEKGVTKKSKVSKGKRNVD